MKKVLLFFLAFTFIFACKEKPSLEDTVIAIHDEVMPKMGAMHVARKDLRSVLQKTEDEALKTEILIMITNLANADEGMMSWMNGWKVPENDPEKTAYLLKEKEKISKVKSDMLTSLEKANAFLEKSNHK